MRRWASEDWLRGRVFRAFVVATVCVAGAACSQQQKPESVTTTTLDSVAIATSLASALVGDGTLVDVPTAACAAEKIDSAFGTTRLYELGLRPGGIVDGAEFISLPLTPEERETVHTATIQCMDTGAVITKLVVDSAPPEEEKAASCVATFVLNSSKLTNTVLVAALEADQKALDEALSKVATFCLAPEDVRVVVPPALTTPRTQVVPGEDVG
jgi:hypothetical protein